MKIQLATSNDRTTLLALMHESQQQESNGSFNEWCQTETAITILLDDPQAGEAYFVLDEHDHRIGYMIMCRGFSLDYGGYFTWVEETYLRKADHGRFRDKKFSP